MQSIRVRCEWNYSLPSDSHCWRSPGSTISLLQSVTLLASSLKASPSMPTVVLYFSRNCTGLGRSPGGGHGNPLQYSCLENPHGQRSLVGYSPRESKESDTTVRLSTAQPCKIKNVLFLCVCFLCIICVKSIIKLLQYSTGSLWWMMSDSWSLKI